jgi:cell division septation protein DedD
MRKNILAIGITLMFSVTGVLAQSYNSWSLQAKGGINSLRARGGNMTDRTFNPIWGGAVEYTFSPIIGIGGEYLYVNNDQSDLNYNSTVHEATVFTSLNLTNLGLKYRQGFWRNFNTYVNVGAGFGFGNWKNNAGKKDDVTNLAASWGLNFEYNVTSLLSVGIEGQYRWNSNGYYNPDQYKIWKDFYTTNLNVRYKIPHGMKSHIRNVSALEYDKIHTGSYSVSNEIQAASAKQDEKITQLETKVEELEMEIAKKDSISNSRRSTPVLSPDGRYVDSDALGMTPPVSASVKDEDIVKESTAPTEKPVNMRTESYVNTSLKRYSVVVGSFLNKDNADGLAKTLKNSGMDVQIVQNEQGMHRVVIFTSNSVGGAVAQVKKIRAKYPDAWVLLLK